MAKEIPISELGMQQLQQLSEQLEQEMELLQNSLSSLKFAQGKLVESKECLTKLTPDNIGKDILVPLTSSMYVAGQLSDVDRVLLDIGTGYYVDETVPKADQYFQRKVDYITKKMEEVQPVLQEKFKMKQAIMEMLQMKVQAQMAAQQSGTVAAKS